MDSRNYVVKKLNEADILEILLEHFPEINEENTSFSRGILFGEPGNNLRFIGVYGDYDAQLQELDLEEIDANHDFNGDHSFLEKNPQFWLTKDSFKKESGF